MLGSGCEVMPAEIPEAAIPSLPAETESPSTSQVPISETIPAPTTEKSTSNDTSASSTTEDDETEPVKHSSAYIKYEGIDGESKSTGHEGWSEIVSFSQPMYKPGTSTDITRSRSDVVIDDIVVIKQVDKASPKFAEALCIGKVFPKVEIHLTGPSEGSTCQGTFYSYELTNAMITSYKVTGSNPLAYALIAPAPDTILPYSGPFIVQAVDAPMEEMSINFEEIKVTYTECDSTGKAKGNVEYSWKVAEGESG